MDGKSSASLAAEICHPCVYPVHGSAPEAHIPLEPCAVAGKSRLFSGAEVVRISTSWAGKTASWVEEEERIFLALVEVKIDHNPSASPAPFRVDMLACHTGCPIFLDLRNLFRRTFYLLKTTWSLHRNLVIYRNSKLRAALVCAAPV